MAAKLCLLVHRLRQELDCEQAVLRNCGVRKPSHGGPVLGMPLVINEGCRQPGAGGWAGLGSVLAISFIQLVLNEVFVSVLC